MKTAPRILIVHGLQAWNLDELHLLLDELKAVRKHSWSLPGLICGASGDDYILVFRPGSPSEIVSFGEVLAQTSASALLVLDDDLIEADVDLRWLVGFGMVPVLGDSHHMMRGAAKDALRKRLTQRRERLQEVSGIATHWWVCTSTRRMVAVDGVALKASQKAGLSHTITPGVSALNTSSVWHGRLLQPGDSLWEVRNWIAGNATEAIRYHAMVLADAVTYLTPS